MENERRYNIKAFCAAAVMLAAVFVLLYFYTGLQKPDSIYVLANKANMGTVETIPEALPDPIEFSLTEYFYDCDQTLSLSGNDRGITKIFYTLDSTPPQTSETAIIFNEPIKLKRSSDPEEIASFTIKSCGVFADGSFTDTVTHSYLLHKDIFERFNTPIFMLSTDPDNLYNYDTGIFVKGRLRDEFLATAPPGHVEIPLDPANYNVRGIESERPVYVEVVDGEGNEILAQNAGMRTFGAYSRDMKQKSIKLFARSEYDPVKNSFDYPFFEGNTSYNGTKINSYKRLVLRNNANDNEFAFLRDEVIAEAASFTDLQDIQNARVSVVFLNGEYYGMVWLKEVFDDNYLDDKNGVKDAAWARLEGDEYEKAVGETDDLTRRANAEFERMYDRYSNADMNNDLTFAAFCNEVDIDNFLTYYAVQIYVANGDWPGGNMEVYKLWDTPIPFFNDNNGTIGTAQSGTGNTGNAGIIGGNSNTGIIGGTGNAGSIGGSSGESGRNGIGTADGRWRWLLYDTDFGFGLYGNPVYMDNLGVLLGEVPGLENHFQSDLLISVLKREDMRLKFAGIFYDLMNHAYSPKNVYNIIDEKAEERRTELEYNYKYGVQLTTSWSNPDSADYQISEIRRFVTDRVGVMRGQIREHLGAGEAGYMNVNIERNENAAIRFNTVDVNDFEYNFAGSYFKEGSFPLSVTVKDGFKFDYFLINGKKYTEPELIVSADMAEIDTVNISAVVSRQTENVLPLIARIDYENAADTITLSNPYTVPVNISGLYISDDPAEPFKQMLPDRIIEPGGEMVIYCKNNSAIDALGEFFADFNLTGGETLTLTDSERMTVTSVFLPELDREYYYERNKDGFGGYVARVKE